MEECPKALENDRTEMARRGSALDRTRAKAEVLLRVMLSEA